MQERHQQEINQQKALVTAEAHKITASNSSKDKVHADQVQQLKVNHQHALERQQERYEKEILTLKLNYEEQIKEKNQAFKLRIEQVDAERSQAIVKLQEQKKIEDEKTLQSFTDIRYVHMRDIKKIQYEASLVRGQVQRECHQQLTEKIDQLKKDFLAEMSTVER